MEEKIIIVNCPDGSLQWCLDLNLPMCSQRMLIMQRLSPITVGWPDCFTHLFLPSTWWAASHQQCWSQSCSDWMPECLMLWSDGQLLVTTGYFYGIVHSINGVFLVLVTGIWGHNFGDSFVHSEMCAGQTLVKTLVGRGGPLRSADPRLMGCPCKFEKFHIISLLG